MDEEKITYDRAELRSITKAFKGMDDEAVTAAKRESGALAEFVLQKVQTKAHPRGIVASRIADGAKVSKSSKIGEISFGYAGQKFSGGATTRDLWGGEEFGSNTFKQFPKWSGLGPKGRGSAGWFIYPTLRALQPEIIAKWETSFNEILKEW
jgi:hypothetical protein